MDAGWSTDPYGRAELRYHDGTAWTEHVATRGVTGVAPLSSVSSVSSVMAPTLAMAGSGFPPPVVAAGGALLPPAPAPAPATAATPRSNRLLAAGIMAILESLPAILMGGYLLSLARTSTVGILVDDASGGILTAFAVGILGFGTVTLTAGIGSFRGRAWGRISTIILHALFTVFWLYIGVKAFLSPSPTAETGPTIVRLAFVFGWLGITLFLAVTGRSTDQAPATPSNAPGADGTSVGSQSVTIAGRMHP